MAASLDALMDRRQRGQDARRTLEVLAPVLADQERAHVTRLVGEFDAGRLSPERALAGVGALSAFRQVVAGLEALVREGDAAGAGLVAGGPRRA